jgi:hypothetical protein
LNRKRARYDDEFVAGTVIVQLLQEEEELKPKRGSVIGRQVVPRDRLNGHARLMEDYFVPNPIYDDDFFHRRYVGIVLGSIYYLGKVAVAINHS